MANDYKKLSENTLKIDILSANVGQCMSMTCVRFQKDDDLSITEAIFTVGVGFQRCRRSFLNPDVRRSGLLD